MVEGIAEKIAEINEAVNSVVWGAPVSEEGYPKELSSGIAKYRCLYDRIVIKRKL